MIEVWLEGHYGTMQDIGWTAADLQEKATLLCLRAYEFYALLSDLAPKSARLYALPQCRWFMGIIRPCRPPENRVP